MAQRGALKPNGPIDVNRKGELLATKGLITGNRRQELNKFSFHLSDEAVFRPLEPKPLVNTSRLVTNAFPNQGSVIQDALVRWKSLQKTKKAARSGPHLADSLDPKHPAW